MQVDVDVYKRLKTVRSDPLPGCSSFFQEHLGKWREQNTAADFSRVAQELNAIVQTMPLLLHHKTQVISRRLTPLACCATC